MSGKIKFNWPIVGQEKIKKFLQTGIANKTLAHAYLFHGPEKVGKAHLARIFAASIVCENFAKGQADSVLPCGQCDPCRQFAKGIYPDLYWLDRRLNEKGEKKADISVEQIRELIEKISMRAFLNNYKIVVIPEAHCLNKAAGNCLLKTLEEPTVQTVIILISPTLSQLLPTIRSRCQALKFLPVSKNLIYDYLIEKGANRNLALELASAACGRPTVAEQFLDSPEQRLEFFASGRDWLKVLSMSAVEKFKFVESFLKKNEEDDRIVDQLSIFSSIARDVLLGRIYKSELASNAGLEKEIAEAALKADPAALRKLSAEIEMTKIRLKQNISPRLVLENLLLNI
ncbi:MAG: DNA polymerase III subunit delta' [Parcubacteria group bacterium]